MTSHHAALTREQQITTLKHLAGGKGLDVVATIMHTTREVVLDLASKHGYPDRDKLAWAADILTKNAEQQDAPTEHPDADAIARQERPRPAAVPDLRSTTKAGTTEQPFPRVDDEQTVRLRTLINTAKGIPTKKVQRQLERALDALTKLQDLVTEDENTRQAREQAQREKEAARAEVQRLQEQLRAAREKLNGPKKPRTSDSTTGDEPPAKVIRAWAADNDVDCPDRGRVPAHVRQAYDDAHREAS